VRRRLGEGLVRDGLVYGVGLALQRGLAFLVLPAATRILDPHDFGVASAAMVVGTVLSAVFALGLNYGIVRLYFDEPADAERTEWAALLRAQVGLACALAGIVWLLGPWWSHIYEDVPWGGALQAAVVLGLALAVQSTLLGILRAQLRVHAFIVVVATQVLVGGSLALALAERDGSAGLVAGLAAGAVASALLGAVLTYRKPHWEWTALRAGVLFSLPFVAHMLASWVVSLSDRVFVERYLGLDALASYQVAYAIGLLPILLSDAMQAAWLPRYYALDDDTKRGVPERLTTPITLAMAAVSGLVVAGAPIAARILAPADYDVDFDVVALVAAATVVRVAYLVAFAALSDAKDTRVIAGASGLGAAVNVGLILWLVPWWGVTGAAAATLVAYAVMSVVTLQRAERLLHVRLRITSLLIVWVAASAALLAIAALPTDALGWSIRVVIAAALVWAGVLELRRTRDGYLAISGA
jgi:O-antigen/teichoic acid export membrane protein